MLTAQIKLDRGPPTAPVCVATKKLPKVINNALRQVRVYEGLEMGYEWAKTKKPTDWWALMTS